MKKSMKLTRRMNTYEDDQGEHRKDSANDQRWGMITLVMEKSESIVHSDDDELPNDGKIQRENV